jgi:hypothetical protein
MNQGPVVNRPLTYAWILLCLALGLHIFDEATTGFLGIYNPTVTALRERLGWWPMPTFEFGPWLSGLIIAVVALLVLTPLVARGAPGTRPLAYFFAILMLLNAGGHMLATIFGRTVAGVTFPRPAPGFWSSPFVALAAIYLLVQLRRSAPHGRGDPTPVLSPR